MSSQSVDSICTASIFTSAEFLSMYNNTNFSTDALSYEALANIVGPNSEFLRAADEQYRLDDLLIALLTHAPHQLGKRYVAVALHVAYDKGMAAVVDVAKLWMEHLFLPLLNISGTIKDPQSEEDVLKEMVSIREEHRCAFTRTVDIDYAMMLGERGLCSPTGTERCMVTTHILPLALIYAKKAATSPEMDPICMWEISVSWTGIDPKKLAESRLKSPANAILVTWDEEIRF